MNSSINTSTKVSVPEDLDFADLRLARSPDGSISFDMSVIKRICQASDLSIQVFRDSPEDNVAGLIVSWYQAHRQQGGDTDPIAEDLIAEVLAEDNAGQKYSHLAGSA